MLKLFGKKAKNAIKEAEAKEKAKKIEAVESYIKWNKNFLERPNNEVDWLDFGKEGYTMFYNLAKVYPDLQEVTEWHVLRVGSPETRVYAWLDDEASWHNWEYFKMLKHQKTFLDDKMWEKYLVSYNNLKEKYKKTKPNYDPENRLLLQNIGPTGGGYDWPYMACAYLSFAFYESSFANNVVKILEDWLKTQKS